MHYLKMTDSQNQTPDSTELLGASPKFSEKYIDQSVHPTDIGTAEQ